MRSVSFHRTIDFIYTTNEPKTVSQTILRQSKRRNRRKPINLIHSSRFSDIFTIYGTVKGLFFEFITKEASVYFGNILIFRIRAALSALEIFFKKDL